ncbi:MAG TPA: hypothetical protein VNY55_18445 [Mycobacterium sp.]|jgi:hypothetical protein|nr:hypothetical protein [Mycobacterium sp.]
MSPRLRSGGDMLVGSVSVHTEARRYQHGLWIADQLMVRVIKRGQPNMILEEQLMPEKKVKVRVSDRWRVVHDGESYVKGDEVTVPEDVAQEWESSGYVERVTGKS